MKINYQILFIFSDDKFKICKNKRENHLPFEIYYYKLAIPHSVVFL